MIDPTPPFEKPTQSIWDPTQKFYVDLLFADKDELQQTFSTSLCHCGEGN